MSVRNIVPVVVPLALPFLAAACTSKEPESEWPKMTCGTEVIASFNLQSTLPVAENSALDLGSQCWRTDLKEAVAGEGGPVVFERTASNSQGACRFTGFANQVRADLTEGLCEFPTTSGHVRFSIREPVGFTPRIATPDRTSDIELTGAWQELRGKDILTGDGTLRLRVSVQRKPTGDEGKVSPTLNAFAGCGAPRCFIAKFAGKGTLLEGGELPCRAFVNTFGQTPFSVRVDDRGYVAFAEKTAVVPPEKWNAGVPGLSGCETTAFTGQRPGQYQEYKIAWDASGKGTMKMLVDALYTDQAATSLCKTSWETTVEPCP
jgi:hypothetical protein